MLVINKNKEVKQISCCQISQLYKKCGFKTENNFKKQLEWTDDKGTAFIVYGKNVGKMIFLNTYTFPPLVENVTLYGSFAIISNNGTEVTCDLLDKLESMQNTYINNDNNDNIEKVQKSKPIKNKPIKNKPIKKPKQDIKDTYVSSQQYVVTSNTLYEEEYVDEDDEKE